MIVKAWDLVPGDYYRGRKIFTLSRHPNGTVRIVVVCPKHLPLVGEPMGWKGKTYISGKFTFAGNEDVGIYRDEVNDPRFTPDIIESLLT